MATFEKVTYDRTEYLHHTLENGTPFPPFTDYQATFSTPLSLAMFADFITPSWLPTPTHFLRLVRAAYPAGVNNSLKLEIKGLYPPLMCVLFP